jgi:hypothetical protein
MGISSTPGDLHLLYCIVTKRVTRYVGPSSETVPASFSGPLRFAANVHMPNWSELQCWWTGDRAASKDVE